MTINKRALFAKTHKAIGAACRGNSVDDLRQCLHAAKPECTPDEYQDLLSRALGLALLHAKADLVHYLVTEENVSVNDRHLDAKKVSMLRSPSVWSELLARGWDINQRSCSSGRPWEYKRLIDWVCDDETLVRWCLDHGAVINDDHNNRIAWPPITECVAQRGTVSTFKLLRNECGAPLGRRVLHLAARGAGTEPADEKRMEMLRYLVDELGLDVNQMDTETSTPEHYGPPLNYAVAFLDDGGANAARFLLDRGADPFLGAAWGAESNAFRMAANEEVKGVLREWKAGHGVD